MERELVGSRKVSGNEVHTRLHQATYEVNVAGQAIDFGDHQGGVPALTFGESSLWRGRLERKPSSRF